MSFACRASASRASRRDCVFVPSPPRPVAPPHRPRLPTRRRAAAAAAGAVLLLSAPVSAARERAHKAVSVSAAWSPGSSVDSLTAGSPSRVVVGFVNAGPDAFNVTGITGWLTDVYEGGRVLANLTGSAVGEVVEAGGELALEFVVKPPRFPRADFPLRARLALAVYYEDEEGASYRSAFLNETVSVAAPKWVQTKEWWATVVLLAAAAAVVVFIGGVPFGFLDERRARDAARAAAAARAASAAARPAARTAAATDAAAAVDAGAGGPASFDDLVIKAKKTPKKAE